MKLLLFTDVHSNKSSLDKIIKKAENSDILVCLGDLTMFQAYMKTFLKELNSVKKPVLMLPGNHESESELKNMCKEFKNIIFLHKDEYETGDLLFLAYGGGGFAENDPRFEAISKTWEKIIKPNQKVILLTHGPPYGTSVDIIGKNHVGNKSYTKFIEKTQPTLALCGHLHENFYKIGRIGKTIVMNPGPDGRIYTI